MASEDFFDDLDENDPARAQAAASAKRRRRTRTIALVALGSAAALGTIVYMTAPAPQEEQVVDASGQPVKDAQGQPVTQHRSSYFPWIWMMGRGGMFGGGGGGMAPGATSGFNTGGGTATAGRTGMAPGGTSGTATSRGGFGAFGRALSGLS